MRHGVTEAAYRRSADLGATARRAGKGEENNPHKFDSTDSGLLLYESWKNGWEGENEVAQKRANR